MRIRKRYTEQEQFEILEKLRTYQGTKKQFCEEHAVSKDTINNWQNKLRDKAISKSPNFIPIQLESTQIASHTRASHCQIVLPNGIVFNISLNSENDFICRLVRTLKGME